MSSTPTIVVADPYSDSAIQRLAAIGRVIMLNKPDEAALVAAVADADALCVRTYSRVTRAVVEAGKRLKVIARAGVGLDNIDGAAAAKRGIPVVYTPAASTHAVADLTIGLILAVQREIARFDRDIRGGDFKVMRAEAPRFPELQHQTVGIIGMGRIGSQVARRLVMGFGTRVLYHDIRPVGPFPFPSVPVTREQLLASADVVTLHVPLTPLTRRMMDATQISLMRRPACLINTSRGPVVVTEDLAAALRTGRIAGAALDVFEPEPPPPGHPILTAPRCVLTPHVASRSPEGLRAMNDVVDDVIAVLQSRPPLWAADADLFNNA